MITIVISERTVKSVDKSEEATVIEIVQGDMKRTRLKITDLAWDKICEMRREEMEREAGK
ncbi:hypothetical protein ES705_16977 [subsurface metagenome]